MQRMCGITGSVWHDIHIRLAELKRLEHLPSLVAISVRQRADRSGPKPVPIVHLVQYCVCSTFQVQSSIGPSANDGENRLGCGMGREHSGSNHLQANKETVGLVDCQRTLFLSICSCQLLKYTHLFPFAVEAS